MTGIERAVAILGSQQKLADRLSVSRQVVGYWVKTGQPPPEYLTGIEKATGGLVTASDLRPDLARVFGNAR